MKYSHKYTHTNDLLCFEESRLGSVLRIRHRPQQALPQVAATACCLRFQMRTRVGEAQSLAAKEYTETKEKVDTINREATDVEDKTEEQKSRLTRSLYQMHQIRIVRVWTWGYWGESLHHQGPYTVREAGWLSNDYRTIIDDYLCIVTDVHRSTSGILKGCPSLDLSSARSRLYRRRLLQAKAHFSAFFKIYKHISTAFHILWIFRTFALLSAVNFSAISSIFVIGSRGLQKIVKLYLILLNQNFSKVQIFWLEWIWYYECTSWIVSEKFHWNFPHNAANLRTNRPKNDILFLQMVVHTIVFS